MKEQSAIDFLHSKILFNIGLDDNDIFKLRELVKIAKKLEEKQHGKTWDSALDKYEVRAGNYMRAYEDFDDYFAETYESKGSDDKFDVLKEMFELELPSHKGSDDTLKEYHIVDTNEMVSSQTEISDAGKDTADYIDRHIIESMKQLAKEGFKPQIPEISDEEIMQRLIQISSLGETYIQGYKDAIIWYREQLKKK